MSVTRTVKKIEAPLQIAYGWVNRSCPSRVQVDTSIGRVCVEFERESKLRNDLVLGEVRLWPRRVSMRLGAWRVAAFIDGRSVWFARRAEVRVEPGGAIVAMATTEALERCAAEIVRRRLAQMRQAMLEVGDAPMRCRLDAVGANETLAVLVSPPSPAGALERAAEILQARLGSHAKTISLLHAREGEPSDPWLRDWLARDEGNARLLEMLKDGGMTYEAIAEQALVSADTVQRVAKMLQARGYIPKRKPGRKRGLGW